MKLRAFFACMFSIAMVCTVFAGLPTARADVDIDVGDFWEYGFDGSAEGITLEASLKYEVKGTTTSGGEDAFNVEVSGSGDVSGSLEDTVVSGSVEFSGYEHRSVADYDILATSMIMTMEISVMGLEMTMSVGAESEYSEGLDTYIGDDNLSLDSTVESSATITSDTWTVFLGENDTQMMIDAQTVTMTVVGVDVAVSVPAGDFVCTKVKVETESSIQTEILDGDVSIQYWYYSEDVKNYVKLEGEDVMGVGASAVELTDYNDEGSGGILGSLTGDNLWVLILIVMVVVVLVVLVAMKMRGRKATPMPPASYMQGPPPAGPMEPGAPPAPPLSPPSSPPEIPPPAPPPA